jgi:archaellum biogenesis protein FlaJ (TadC family)
MKERITDAARRKTAVALAQWSVAFAIGALVALLGLVWRPYGVWWQWLATVAVLGLTSLVLAGLFSDVTEKIRKAEKEQ